MNRDEPLASHLLHSDPALAAVVNRWLLRRNGASMRVGAREFALQWQPALAAPTASNACLTLRLVCQQHRAQLWLADLAAIDPRLVGELFTALPAPIKELVIQRVLADFVALLPPALAAALEVQSLHWGAVPHGAQAIAFVLERDGVQMQGMLCADTADELRWLDDNLPLGDVPPPLAPRTDLPLAATFHLGRAMAAARHVRALRDGDVLRLGRGGIGRDGIAATLRVAQQAQQWTCRLRRRSATLVAADNSAAAVTLEYHPQEQTPMTAPQALDFEVPVDVELAPLSLTLAQIERLLPGQSLELPQDVSDAAVTLRVHGKAIAQGKLVVIGRALGVRVEQVFADGVVPVR
jgi:type III secretion system YscQ/HrcQ family protein